jgi:predicted transcriptional regulator
MDLQELVTRGRFIFASAPERLALYCFVDGKQNTAQLAKKTRRHVNNVRRDLNRMRDVGLVQPKLDKSGTEALSSGLPVY